MTYNTLITAIQTIVKNANIGLQEVYDTEVQDLAVFPCATILPKGHKNNMRSLGQNERLYTVVIQIYGSLTDEFIDTQKKIRTLTDSLINVLEKQSNLNLSNEVDWSDATEASFSFNTSLNLYVAQITLTVHAMVNRASL